MLDPRIYRAALVPVAVAVLVLAFSFGNQPGSLGTNLAPDAFNGQNVAANMARLGAAYPNRRPGSIGDDSLAGTVAAGLTSDGFSVSTSSFAGRTVDGTRTLEAVLGVRTGFSSRRIVVVAHRDALSSPATADLSGTATLLELARVLGGRTLNRTIVLASTSGSIGAAGAEHLAGALGGPVDAVLVLGDTSGTGVQEPLVVPWSNARSIAPPLLRNTVAAALGAQASLRPGGLSLAGQLARLAFPLTISEQGPFGAHGQPAVLLSTAGERGPARDAAADQKRLTAIGRATLQTISSLDQGKDIPAPSAYLLFDNKVIPAWAIQLLVLALILPVLGATIDGCARARRRGHAVGRWIVWVLAAAIPFVLASLLIVGWRLTGLLPATPPGPVGAGVVPMQAAGVGLLVAIVCVIALASFWLRPFLARLAGAGDDPAAGGGAAAVLAVMCAITVVIWVGNPFAAALMIPALNLWIWVVAPDVRMRRPVALALLAIGVAPFALVGTYYALTLGLDPIGLLWTGVLLLAGGQLSMLAALQWSIVLGCLASVTVIALAPAREDQGSDLVVSIRGPVTYAGPGSLGGTKSALRR